MKLYTKETLIAEFHQIARQGWIPNARGGNSGGVGNTLEDLLGIRENNLPLANAAEWELKAQRADSHALTTLFHSEPSPRAIRFVPQALLPNYGWQHPQAGSKYPASEMSFRQTVRSNQPTDRGFSLTIDRRQRKVLVSFNHTQTAAVHQGWLNEVNRRVGLGELNPQPYWGFDDLAHKAGTKLLNCFYVQAEVKTINGHEHYRYSQVTLLQKFSFQRFLRQLDKGNLFVDFDARSGHNHGTKFRVQPHYLPQLYEHATVILQRPQDV